MKIIELKETITASNDRDAEVLRSELKEQKTLLVNLMASPGAGKTTLLERTIQDLGSKYRIAVMEADVDSDVDAKESKWWVPKLSRRIPAVCVIWMPA